jgi:predicted N-acetyltransferase YhbS
MNIHIRPATKADLDPVNQLIKDAVMTWNLPERVKRLSISSYYYSDLDLKHLEIRVAEDDNQHIVGVIAWEEADSKDTPAGKSALLLHGIYVDPKSQQQGIGRQLFRAAEQNSQQHKYDGLLVKAQEDANAFFLSQGMTLLPVEDTSRHYANRFWKSFTRD